MFENEQKKLKKLIMIRITFVHMLMRRHRRANEWRDKLKEKNIGKMPIFVTLRQCL